MEYTMEKDKIIAIYCGISPKEDVFNLQEHLFDNGCQWYSSKYNGERKFKEKITDYILIEGNEIFEAPESMIRGTTDYVIIIFNSPMAYLRFHKIKKLKTKLS